VERSVLQLITDDDLLVRLADIMRQSRRTEADLVAHLAEVDQRKLYAREACPSMFAYCVEVLHLSEAEAYLRIAAARASRAHPLLLDMLADGRLHLSGIGKLAPHLTSTNAQSLLSGSAHKTKRQIEELVASLAPRPDVPSSVRRLPQRITTAELASASNQTVHSALRGELSTPERAAKSPASGEPIPSELRPDAVGSQRAACAAVEPLGEGRYKVQFTASAAFNEKLRRLQALTRNQAGDGDLGALIEAAVTEKLERLEARRFARTGAPRKALESVMAVPTSRYIPAAVRRAVFERDGARCCYRDPHGRRCSERERLEFHHRLPFAHGGDHGFPNIGLLCRAHNVLMAETDYGSTVESYGRGS
jgi:hypothetical protein